MRIIELFVGGLALVFLLPVFVKVWHGLASLFTAGISNPIILLYYITVPYIWIILFIIAAFMIASRRPQ